MYNLDKRNGNTGTLGRYFWRIENQERNGDIKRCIDWITFQDDVLFRFWYDQQFRSQSSNRRLACPCTIWQAFLDRGRFSPDFSNPSSNFCLRSRRSRIFIHFSDDLGFVLFRIRQLCCYSFSFNDFGALITGPPDGSHAIAEPIFGASGVTTDRDAETFCCADPDLCNLYYFYRPSDDCFFYRPRRRRWFWGDPHFRTLDGGNYTFNGLGEYVMIDAQDGVFQLQARTSLAQQNSTTATIFSAGAAKEENTSVVEVKVKKGGGIDILIEETIYPNYAKLTNQTIDVGGNLSFSKPEANCVEVFFPSTTSVQFCEKREMLSFVVTLSEDYRNSTRGLLGTWNDNPNDDFTLPDGTILPSSLTSRKIHFDFGVKWQINQSQSLFTYAQNESVDTFAKPDFLPMFIENITWFNASVEREARTRCGDDIECLFDAAATNDVSVGLVTKDINIQLENETKILENFPPVIVNASDVINATLGGIVQFNITAEDEDPVKFEVINKPKSATVTQSGNFLYFDWPVLSSQKFNLSIVATDDKGASALWNPTIRMCACNNDGQCIEPEEGDSINTDIKFIYLGCACQGGYTGRFCESEIDACELNGQPCYIGVTCIDLPPPANVSGYICGPCPTGFTGDGAQCLDIDECQTSNTNNCEQICVNTAGSYYCTCRDGFTIKADKQSCEDINECEPSNDCMHKCDNTPGSFNCSCNQFFVVDPADWRKCVATNPCSPDPGCEHVCFRDANNEANCDCFANFELQSDGKTCTDINECDPANPLHRCSHICQNIDGGYNCSCPGGYRLSDDGYTCDDINECVDDRLFNCTDTQRCINDIGTYRCDCGENLFFIDGQCRALEINETVPIPELPEPRMPSAEEELEAVQITIVYNSNFKWDYTTDLAFKVIMASVASEYCNVNRTECALTVTRQERIDLYLSLRVHLLPGYPINASGTFFVAFYVQQPAGLFIGNQSVLPSNALVEIIQLYKRQIEAAIGANITGVEALFKPTSTPTELPVAPTSSSDDTVWIIIGVLGGLVLLLLIILIVMFVYRRRNKGKLEIDWRRSNWSRDLGGEGLEEIFEIFNNNGFYGRDNNLEDLGVL
ncbi:mucin-like protein [Porites lutea]|uniref:mucin-like protein n=1 Tax=Porites lutea TaxID=51062 RepID=UPI003CC61239